MSFTIFEVLVLAVFCVWFALSIPAQFHSKKFDEYRRFDVFHLIPNWTFFAPNPGCTDYHVIFRDRRPDASVTDWDETPLIPARSRWSFLWNPDKRETKVLADAVSSIIEMIELGHENKRPIEITQKAMLLHSPYLLLLSIVMNRKPPAAGSTHRQFAIVERFGFANGIPLRLIISSPFHAFDA
jgi:hypothetical protein